MTSMDGFVFVRTIVVAFGVAGAMARPAYVQAAPSANPDDPRAEQQVREASTAEVKAFIHKDANRLASLW